MGEKKREMVIRIDVESGKLIQVTDEGGEKAATGLVKELQLGGKPLLSVPDYTVMRTLGSPVCIWIFFDGQWHRICSPPKRDLTGHGATL